MCISILKKKAIVVFQLIMATLDKNNHDDNVNSVSQKLVQTNRVRDRLNMLHDRYTSLRQQHSINDTCTTVERQEHIWHDFKKYLLSSTNGEYCEVVPVPPYFEVLKNELLFSIIFS